MLMITQTITILQSYDKDKEKEKVAVIIYGSVTPKMLFKRYFYLTFFLNSIFNLIRAVFSFFKELCSKYFLQGNTNWN